MLLRALPQWRHHISDVLCFSTCWQAVEMLESCEQELQEMTLQARAVQSHDACNGREDPERAIRGCSRESVVLVTLLHRRTTQT